jgi:hypothetical protein
MKKMIRYGTVAEQKFIDEFKNEFDLLVINGNMMSHASTAISKFLATRSIKYIIDPLTHSLQHDIQLLKGKNGKIKSSFQKMIANYSEYIAKKVLEQEKVLIPSDFSSPNVLKSFTESVLSFQKNHVIQSVKDKDYYKYLVFKQISFEPEFLVVPYFMMNTRNFIKWLPINIDMIQYSSTLYSPDDLAAQIVIDQDILAEKEYINILLDHYTQIPMKRILIWIDDFSAFEASKKLIDNYCYFINQLNKQDKEVFNLYGDYFSILLCHVQSPARLSGVCHGLEYGEKRAVIPVGGGIPINKYYLYPIHQRIDYGRVATLLFSQGILPKDYQRYYDEICECPTCKEVIGTDMDNFDKFGDSSPVEIKRRNGISITRQFPTGQAKELCIKHFLYCKLKEWEDLSRFDLELLIKHGLERSQKYADILGYDYEAAYSIWLEVLGGGEK